MSFFYGPLTGHLPPISKTIPDKTCGTLLEKQGRTHVTFFYGPLHGHLPPISKTIPDKQNMWNTAGETRTNSSGIFFCGPQHMDVLALADQQEIIYISSVRTQDIV